MSEFNNALRTQAEKLASGEITEIVIKKEWIDQAIELASASGKAPNINASYLRMTVSRAVERCGCGSGVKIRFKENHEYKRMMTDPETHEEYEEVFTFAAFVITLNGKKPQPGKANRSPTAAQTVAYKSGLGVMLSFVPDFIDYTPEEFAIAQKIVKQYRDHATRLIGGEA